MNTNKNLLTVHVLFPVLWGNLNRDDLGAPKKTVSGGVMRSMLSPQSIKRAARTTFEGLGLAGGEHTYRSTRLAVEIARPIVEAHPELDGHKIAETAIQLVTNLTAADKSPKDKKAQIHAILTGEELGEVEAEKNGDNSGATATWMSADEIAAARKAVLEIVLDGRKLAKGEQFPSEVISSSTPALSIAALGRMNASAKETNIDAAVSVGPAITVHRAVVESDFFTAVDDLATGSGAAHMGSKMHTSGVFYRTFTIDRRELELNWSAYGNEGAQEAVAALVDALITALPTGMSTNSAPYAQPYVVLAEEQAHRNAYSFETPVVADREGGFEQKSVERLSELAAAARRFRARQFGRTMVVGTHPLTDSEGNDLFAGAERPEGGFDEMVDQIAAWVVSK